MTRPSSRSPPVDVAVCLKIAAEEAEHLGQWQDGGNGCSIMVLGHKRSVTAQYVLVDEKWYLELTLTDDNVVLKGSKPLEFSFDFSSHEWNFWVMACVDDLLIEVHTINQAHRRSGPS